MKKTETVFPTNESRINLRKLETLLSNPDPITCEFGKYLSVNLPKKITAKGFVIYTMMTIRSLSDGEDCVTAEPIESNLVGYPIMIYNILQKSIPEIADAIFPKSFAKEIRDFVKEVEKR